MKLKEENQILRIESQKALQLKEENSQLKKELFRCKADILKIEEESRNYKVKGMPEIRKETNKVLMLTMIGTAITALLSIIMFKTQKITRLRALCEVLFKNELFGPEASNQV
jgi:hypothetical protein